MGDFLSQTDIERINSEIKLKKSSLFFNKLTQVFHLLRKLHCFSVLCEISKVLV